MKKESYDNSIIMNDHHTHVAYATLTGGFTLDHAMIGAKT